MTAVAPIKLTLHLLIATAILASLVWVATGLGRSPASDVIAEKGRAGARILLALVFLQIALGGLVAGSKAGLTYNTWPLMDGQLVPSSSVLFSTVPWLENFVDNVALVQFNHRLVAYGLVGFALWHAFGLWRAAPAAAATRRATALAGMAVAQMVLGIVTLVLVVPLWAGLAHQVFAMLVLAMAVVHLRALASS
jgi:cytochrome c oxidase assembly protein subunit 15